MGLFKQSKKEGGKEGWKSPRDLAAETFKGFRDKRFSDYLSCFMQVWVLDRDVACSLVRTPALALDFYAAFCSRTSIREVLRCSITSTMFCSTPVCRLVKLLFCFVHVSRPKATST